MHKNPKYPPWHCFTVVKFPKCGESYEPICELDHICKKQNSYPSQPDKKQNGEKENV